MGDWRDNLIDDDAGLRRILAESRTIAVLGAKAGAGDAAYFVPAYLVARGYRILPVNPRLGRCTVHGMPAVDGVAELREPVDVIEVFRAPQHLPAHADEILAMPAPPRVVWFQLGIRNDAAAQSLARVGIRVVQNRCMMPEHRRLLGSSS